MADCFQTPEVSVIINCFNGERYLREAIDSVYGQSFLGWEIVFWDNASTDMSGEIARGCDSRLRYFRGNKTVSLGLARNLAMENARGSYIAFLDCDDWWVPEKLESQMRCFQDPQVGLAYSDWILFNEKGYACARYNGRRAPQGWVFEQTLFNNFTCLSTLMIKREVVRRDGILFDPQFSYIEDTDFITRIARSWKFAYVPRALTWYRMHSASATATQKDGFRDEEERLVRKYRSIFPEFTPARASRQMMTIAKDRAVTLWRKGSNSEARRMLLPGIFGKWSYPLILLLMFFPYQWVDSLRKACSRKPTGYYS